ISQIDDAVNKGAEVLTGAKYDENKEKSIFFVRPTVLSNITDEMVIMSDETFGPVAPVTKFSDLEEVLEKANDTPFGLASYFFTDNYRTGQYIFENLD